MRPIFDFNDSQKAEAEETMRRKWNKFRNSLATGKFRFDQLQLAKKETFLKGLNDMFQDNDVKEFFTISLKEMISSGTQFCRGAKLKCREEVSYNRFIPQKELINEDNRFSPKGYEWLYLAMQNNMTLTSDTYEPMEKCCISECQIKVEDRVGLCHFELNNGVSNKTVVNLTIGEEYTFDTINNNLGSFAQRNKQKGVSDFLLLGKNIDSNIQQLLFEYEKWAALTYSKMMSEQLFVPLETDDKELTFAPFQCLAQYFISQGFCGIIYKSTVCCGMKNIVLFDKLYAKPTGTIKDNIYIE